MNYNNLRKSQFGRRDTVICSFRFVQVSVIIQMRKRACVHVSVSCVCALDGVTDVRESVREVCVVI